MLKHYHSTRLHVQKVIIYTNGKKLIDIDNITGTCPVCTINQWESRGNKPMIWPCNIKGCPYEDEKDQNKIDKDIFSDIGSGLGQIEF